MIGLSNDAFMFAYPSIIDAARFLSILHRRLND